MRQVRDIVRGQIKICPRGSINRKARIKLEMLNAAVSLASLRVPPGNRLERLQGDRAGQYSIRINSRYRVCFVWQDGHAFAVEIVDYH